MLSFWAGGISSFPPCVREYRLLRRLGLNDFRAQIIDVTDVNKPTERESFWIEKLNTYVPLGLNLREEH